MASFCQDNVVFLSVWPAVSKQMQSPLSSHVCLLLNEFSYLEQWLCISTLSRFLLPYSHAMFLRHYSRWGVGGCRMGLPRGGGPGEPICGAVLGMAAWPPPYFPVCSVPFRDGERTPRGTFKKLVECARPLSVSTQT